MLDFIKSFVKSHLPELIAIRRHLHAHPELSFHEYETMVFISKELTNRNVGHETAVGDTGIVGKIGIEDSPCLAL